MCPCKAKNKNEIQKIHTHAMEWIAVEVKLYLWFQFNRRMTLTMYDQKSWIYYINCARYCKRRSKGFLDPIQNLTAD